MNDRKNDTNEIENEQPLTTLDELVEVLNEDELRHLAWGGRSGPRTVGPGHGRKV